ncbi:hypothetical protein PABY_03230 [Pyrodictium abyssi]|uniref:Uncharacterized protein n=2 Tax=Pyrodictium abyssi TaxID=54256 RepID=A0ABN6ZKJ5_9CREN|nr:hypothetical protein PABY_03230 [Pyrodictium abyssi]
MDMIKRWPRRREFLAYYLLLKYAKARSTGESEDDLCVNAGEAIDLLNVLTGSKRLSSSLLKQLVKRGFLERRKALVYCIKEVDALLDEALVYYLAGRLRRRGIEATVSRDHGHRIVVFGRDSCSEIAEKASRIGIKVECVDDQR